MPRLFLIAIVCFVVLGSASAAELRVFQLQHRSAEEILPLVKPLVGEDAAVSGRGYKLIVRASEQELAQIEQLLSELDTRLQQLHITVAMASDKQALYDKFGLGAEAQVGDNGRVRIGETEKNLPRNGASASIEGDKTRIHTEVYRSQSRQTSPSAQSTRVTEGHWATIRTGYAMPYVEQQRHPDGTVTRTMRYRNVMTGFEVLPQLSGDTITLQIRPQRQQLSPKNGGRVDIQGMVTTVSGKLGEWIALGGAEDYASRAEREHLSTLRTKRTEQQQIWVKVERVE